VAYHHSVLKRVEFSETDMAGIVHFSNFFRYMECAEHDFFRSLGASIFPEKPDNSLGWPRVSCKCDFKAPLRFEDVARIDLYVYRISNSSITYRFLISTTKSEEKQIAAFGRMTTVCVTRDSTGKMRSTTIPNDLRSRIEECPKALMDTIFSDER